MAKKDHSDAIKSIMNKNISPVQSLLSKSVAEDEEKIMKTDVENDVAVKKDSDVVPKKRKPVGRPAGTKKPVKDLKTNTITMYFSDNELNALKNANIMQAELSSILRLRLKEMGVNISIK